MTALGRRRGPTQTRQAILDAARSEFARHGYDGATIRGIAAEAGVDPALVHYFFRTKEQLLTAALELPVSPAAALADVLAAGLDGAGERLVARFVEVWDVTGDRGPMMAVIRSAASEEAPRETLRQFIAEAFFTQIDEATADHGELRAGAVVAQLLGLAMARYALALEPLASADRGVVVALVGPAVQHALTGPVVPARPRGRSRARTNGR